MFAHTILGIVLHGNKKVRTFASSKRKKDNKSTKRGAMMIRSLI